MGVVKNWIVGLNDPLLVEFRWMNVHEQSLIRTLGNSDFAQHPTQLARTIVFDGGGKQAERSVEIGRSRTREGFIREYFLRPQIDDRLIDDFDCAVVENGPNR